MLYDDYIILYNVRNNLSTLKSKLHADGADPVSATEFLLRTYAMREDESYNINFNVQYSSLDSNFTKFSIDIRAIEQRYLELLSEYNAWSLIAEGNCTDACKTGEIQIKNCTCYSSSTVRLYYSQLSTLSNLQMRILRYTGRGDKTELKQFQDRALSVRFNFEEAFIHLSQSTDNIADSQLIVEKAQNLTTQLKVDFDAWELLNNPTTPCYICSPSQIKQSCYSCITIIDWDKLTNVENGLPGLLTEINNLNNSTNQNMLKANW